MQKILGLSLMVAMLIGGAAKAMNLKPPPQSTLTPWGGFRIASANGRDIATVEVALLTRPNTAGARPETTWINETREQIWVAEKRVKTGDAPVTLQWTSSGACYQLIETLVILGDLDRPTAPATVVDRSASGDVIRIDGFGLNPSAGHPGTLRLTTGVPAPAAAVVVAALKAWAPCWSDAPPTFDAP